MPANLVQLADGSTTFSSDTRAVAGNTYGVNSVSVPITASTTDNQTLFVVPRPMVVKTIGIVPDTAASGACTINFKKATSGVTATSGVALLSSAINMSSAAVNTFVAGSLTSTAGALSLVQGDRITFSLASGTMSAVVASMVIDGAWA